VHVQSFDALSLLYRLAVLEETNPALHRHVYRGRRIGRYSDHEVELVSLDAPGADDLAVYRVVLTPRVRQVTSRVRTYDDAGVARCLRRSPKVRSPVQR
jgi:hypothetical protein